MKSAVIDRRPNCEKEVSRLKEKCRKKSSFLLSTILVKTIADFDGNIVGNGQVDFVESRGSLTAGEYANNLSIRDTFSSWRERGAIMGIFCGFRFGFDPQTVRELKKPIKLSYKGNRE